MGGSDRDMPFFFMKPADALFQSSVLKYPPATSQLDYEAELVAFVGEQSQIFGYALGVDLTKRDLQKACKKQGRPWECSKSFDFSGLVGVISPGVHIAPNSILSLTVNGETKQIAHVSDMIWSVNELMEQLRSQDLSVATGDVIFTGTPAGVGALRPGDRVEVYLTCDNKHVLPPLRFDVVSRNSN
jgi:fumarylpyruvate hydrolase